MSPRTDTLDTYQLGKTLFMATIVDCPSCSRKLRVPDELLGKQVQCPVCSITFTSPVQVGTTDVVDVEYADEEASPPGSQPYPPRGSDHEPPFEEEYDEEPRVSRRSFRHARLQPDHGSTILTLGILSLFVAGPILGAIAWVMGNNDLREIRAGRMNPEGEESVNAGRICGMIATILHSVLLVLCLFACYIWAFNMAFSRGRF